MARFRALDAACDARFVLDTRPLEHWLRGPAMHYARRRRALGRPGLEAQFGTADPAAVAAGWRALREEHHRRVRAELPPGRLPVFDIESDSPERLCEFIGRASGAGPPLPGREPVGQPLRRGAGGAPAVRREARPAGTPQAAGEAVARGARGMPAPRRAGPGGCRTARRPCRGGADGGRRDRQRVRRGPACSEAARPRFAGPAASGCRRAARAPLGAGFGGRSAKGD